MRDLPQRLTLLAIVVGLCLASSPVGAETCTLAPNKVEASHRGYRFGSSTPDWLFAMTSSQTLMAQFVPKAVIEDGKETTAWEPLPGDRGYAQFKKLVKREPAKYNAACPFRGAVKLGDREYAFVFDAVDSDSPTYYGLLYFDCNGNGDLTDDGVIESIQAVAAREAKKKAEEEKAKAKEDETKSPEPANERTREKKPSDATAGLALGRALVTRTGRAPGMRMSPYQSFPPVDVTIEVDGKRVDYRFFLTVYSVLRKEFAYARAMVSSGVYYEGEINLDGRSQRVVLVDYNSNGRFDDKTGIAEVRRDAKGPARLSPVPGDVLYLDPKPIASPLQLGGVAGPDFRYNVEKLISIGGKYYDMKVSAAGDALSIAPSEVPLGSVKNPNANYTAMLRSDLGTIRIKGTKDQPVAVPVGKWALLAATIELPEAKSDKEKKSDEDKADKEKKGLDAALAAAEAKKDEMQLRRIRLSQAMLARARNTPRTSLASAMGTTAGAPVKVVAGETALLPFGPPYKTSVSASAYQPQVDSLRLNLAIYGAGGEVITGLRVNGKQPPVPHVKILDPSGEVANEGDFRYG